MEAGLIRLFTAFGVIVIVAFLVVYLTERKRR